MCERAQDVERDVARLGDDAGARDRELS